jgi:AcrR family transcriptional regulator
MCFTLAIKPFEFLTANALAPGNPRWFVIDQLPVVTRGQRKRITAAEKEQMRLALEQVLAEDIRPRPTLQAVAQRLGHDVTILQKHWPSLCEAIVARYRGRPTRRADHHLIQQALEEALKKDRRVALESIAKQLGCSVATLRRHCPDLCRALVQGYRTRFDNGSIEQHLRDVVASSEPVPSLEALARQIGCTTALLCYRFPELCSAITSRRRVELHQQHDARMEKICSEVRQAVVVIHQQGRYPSTRQVAKLLSNPQDIRSNEARETWRTMVAALGYKGRVSLDKGAEGMDNSEQV